MLLVVRGEGLVLRSRFQMRGAGAPVLKGPTALGPGAPVLVVSKES